MPNLSIQSASYQGAFAILTSDIKRLCEFIEPVDAHLSVYSHRIFELLLRTCTEWESLCKEALVAAGDPTNPEDMKVNDYVKLNRILDLDSVEVGILFWRPLPAYVRPYEAWTTSHPPLKWYSGYNSVKHNRNTEFDRASLEHLRLAAAALFALHVKFKFIIQGSGDTIKDVGIYKEYTYRNQLFSFRAKK